MVIHPVAELPGGVDGFLLLSFIRRNESNGDREDNLTLTLVCIHHINDISLGLCLLVCRELRKDVLKWSRQIQDAVEKLFGCGIGHVREKFLLA